MLKELTKPDWMSMLDIPEERIPSTLVLWGTRNLRARYTTVKDRLVNVLEVGSPNDVVEDVLIGEYSGIDVGYGSVYGAPMASEVTHIFGVLGTSQVIQIGTCGGLADDLLVGHLFSAESAYCGEGASQYYLEGKKTVAATTVFNQGKDEASSSSDIKRGRIYTTSALFAEGLEDVERWASQGFSAIDMETAATFAVAEHFGMDRANLLVVFDNPRRREHILIDDSEKDRLRAAAQERMLEVALTCACRTHW